MEASGGRGRRSRRAACLLREASCVGGLLAERARQGPRRRDDLGDLCGLPLALGDLITAVEEDGTQLLIVAFPARWQLGRLRRARDAGEDLEAVQSEIAGVQAHVARVAAERGIPVLDLLTPFFESEEEPFGDMALEHPGPAGYRLTAERAHATLREQGWL